MGDKIVSRLLGILCKALLGRQFLPYQRPMVHTMCFHLSFATCAWYPSGRAHEEVHPVKLSPGRSMNRRALYCYEAHEMLVQADHIYKTKPENKTRFPFIVQKPV